MRIEDYIYYENISSSSFPKTATRFIKFVCNWWRTIPCQVAYYCSKNKALVLSDFGNYSNMVRTLIFAKHNRNLFYHRMGRGSILYSWILPGEGSLKLPFSCKLGRHILFVHNDSCHLNANEIGDHFICYPHVIIGTKSLLSKGKPTIGNKVTLGSGVVIVGDITIGNNVLIGANSFINFSIPDNCVVMGNPGKVVKQK